MRVFALSDVHVDFDANAQWVESLSREEYRQDVLILAGDVSDSLPRLQRCLEAFAERFARVFFVPGNHDLWVVRDQLPGNSLDKFDRVQAMARNCGATVDAEIVDGVAIVPLLGWYDGSFGQPGPELKGIWMDFHACRWPQGWTTAEVADHFMGLDPEPPQGPRAVTISFSHFMPRLDLMPGFIPPSRRQIYPVLGSRRLDERIRGIGADIHVYGHSHLNRDVVIDGIHYVNNAFAYPYEEAIAARALKCIYRTR